MPRTLDVKITGEDLRVRAWREGLRYVPVAAILLEKYADWSGPCEVRLRPDEHDADLVVMEIRNA
jgi:hypothetical protein